MQIYDITKELFSTPVFPGDPEPKYSMVSNMKYGDDYNLSNISLCPHNATHMDAPYHFINNGASIEQIELSRCIGRCLVAEVEGYVDKDDIRRIISLIGGNPVDKILFKGKGGITKEAAKELVKHDIVLVGAEEQVIAAEGSEIAVHRILLKKEIVILENLDLHNVNTGEYCLVALPLKMKGIEASPVRAILIKE